MDTKDDGGPAFPFGEIRYDGGNHPLGKQYSPGMTLRQWYAGMALQALGTWTPGGPLPSSGDEWLKEVVRRRAVFAYEQADAMIAAERDRG